jgi:hypothetical protein
MGASCPVSPADAPVEALLHADACQISLLAQYEMSARSPATRRAAIDGLQRLHERWPTEPSLQFNLARLLTHAGKGSEAEPLWDAFVRDAADGPYRAEAQAQRRRLAPSTSALPGPEPAVGPAGAAAPALTALAPPCKKAASGVPVSATSQRYLSRCGSWSDEFVVRDTREVLVRSVSARSALWPNAAPPSTVPLFVSHDATGDVVRVWDQEAWVFTAGAPTRVVYFKRAQ